MDRRRKPPANTKAERNTTICARLRSGGITITELAAELCLTRERVRQIALREGITAATYQATLPPSKTEAKAAEMRARKAGRQERRRALVSRIVELRQQGLNQRAIAALIGKSQNAVSLYLIAAGRRSVHKPLRVFLVKKRARKRAARNRRVGAPAFVNLPKSEQVAHADQTIRHALDLWNAGLSAQRIALRLTSNERPISKNVIIGLAHRNKFPARPSPIKSAD